MGNKGSKMNERILELAREAGLLAHNPTGVPTKLEKFAQLIVQECVDRIKRVGILEDIEIEGDMISDAVKEHFGVEE
jgi:hypothetical protein